MSYTAAVITVSDRAAAGVYQDKSAPAVCALLSEEGYAIAAVRIVPDEKDIISEAILAECKNGVSLIVTSGGTGFSPRDVTPEATKAVIQREAPGIAEYMRQKSMEITPRGMLSRGVAGICGRSLIINLPGSPKGASENLGFILPHLRHGLDMLNGMEES